MLLNERYTGKFVWNKRKWLRVPGQKSRRSMLRPASEWVVADRPDLAIIPQELWNTVQERFGERRRKGSGRQPGDAKRPSPVSGVLRCGTCGSSMSGISCRVNPGGVRYANLGCSANRSKGNTICDNDLCISERKVVDGVVDVVRGLVSSPELPELFARLFLERVAAAEAAAPPDPLARDVAGPERRVRNLVEALATLGTSQAVGAQLRDEEQKLRQLRDQLERSRAAHRRACKAPEVDQAKRYLADLAVLIEKAPERCREVIRRLIPRLTMTPRTEGEVRYYEAEGELALKAEDSATFSGDRVFDKDGCGGRI
jgi:hypothetical protein